MSKADRQAEYLRAVAETGSLVQARRRVGVGSKTVAEWRRDPEFCEAVQDAVDVANDAIRAKVREMALDGDTSMLTLSMRVIEPALRPQSSVNVGVQVDSRRQQLTPDELWAKVEKIREERIVRGEILPDNPDDPRWRQIGVGSVVEAEVVVPPPTEVEDLL